MGYPTRLVDRFPHYLMMRTDPIVPSRFQLAVTAALEHYTATVAERLLTSPEAQELLGENELRSMLLWHALEESENKTVAFDVYWHTGGSERLRIATMWLWPDPRTGPRRTRVVIGGCVRCSVASLYRG